MIRNRNDNNDDKDNSLLEWAEQVMREVNDQFKDVKDEDIPEEILPSNVSGDPNTEIFLFLKDEDEDEG
jgi:hypothetical protein